MLFLTIVARFFLRMIRAFSSDPALLPWQRLSQDRVFNFVAAELPLLLKRFQDWHTCTAN